MFKEKVEKAIEKIQSEFKDIKEFPSLIEVCEPGESGFKPRTVGSTGYVLLCPIDINYKKSVVQGAKPNLTDYMGVSPFMMVVMESGSTLFKPCDIVILDRNSLPMGPDGLPHFTQIIIRGAVAIQISESNILGVDQYLTDLVKNTETIKPLADA